MSDFQSLEQRYGEVVAFAILTDMERHLRLNQVATDSHDLNQRYQNAVALMEKKAA